MAECPQWVEFSDAPLLARLFLKNLIIMTLRECAVVTVARMEQIKLSNHVALDIFRNILLLFLYCSMEEKFIDFQFSNLKLCENSILATSNSYKVKHEHKMKS